MTLDTQSVLGASGRVAQRLKQYEQRPEQLEMAQAVERAIAERAHLVVEAGTGVGKSFAYLVPAILAAANRGEGGSRRRIVVSTNTISLQEQLIHKDIPFLNAVLPVEFSAVLVKGRSNYISLRRLKGTVERSLSAFVRDEELNQLQELAEWARRTDDGSLSDLPSRPLPQVWDEVRSEHGNCLGKKCPTHQECFYYQARRRVWNADVLVVNHALFFSDLALRREGANLLPDYDIVIFDEAHTLEAVAGDHLGIAVSSGQLEYLLNKLYNDRQQKGLLTHHRLHDCERLVEQMRFTVADFFCRMREWLADYGSSNGRIKAPVPLEDPVSPLLSQLAARITQRAKALDSDEQRIELLAAADRCAGLAASLIAWMGQTQEDSVYWVEFTGKNQQQTRLVCAPIEIGPVLRDELFAKVPTAILTSATLSVGTQSFEFAKARVGLTQAHELKLGSPFDYRSQVRLVLPAQMPDPAAQGDEYEQAVCEKIRKHVDETKGRAFVLFTSYRMLRTCADRLTGWMASRNYGLYCQGEAMPRNLMLERFRQDRAGVLFGTDSFWQGVDVPGDALQNVIITKLPFSVPDQPLLEARLELIRARGGNPFLDFQLPEAIIKLKQGFGRLIRSRSDRGQVVILDPRVRTKPYGKLFLESLPECNLVIDAV